MWLECEYEYEYEYDNDRGFLPKKRIMIEGYSFSYS